MRPAADSNAPVAVGSGVGSLLARFTSADIKASVNEPSRVSSLGLQGNFIVGPVNTSCP